HDKRRVVVVGAGSVGATYCYALAQSGLADEIVLIDKNTDLAKGQVMDLEHGQPFFPTVEIRTGSPEDYTRAQVVVITAGITQKPDETRLHLLKKNTEIVSGIARDVADHHCKGIMLIVSNPVDILTYSAIQSSGWPRERVIGSGTLLDSARFRHLLSRHCDIDIHNVHAYILGEHGDSEFAAWSLTNIAGISMNNYCSVCRNCKDWEKQYQIIEQQVRESAYHIINYKGSTHYAVGMAVVRITEAILRKQQSILAVSALLDGEFGIHDVCLSVPCIISGTGIRKIIDSPLPEKELQALQKSAEILLRARKEIL
ncbi:MAG: L-lactate dehydrogenase, partial [Bacteroidota bacterium]|nr:L-lactate dehydrogenase [Bacteroidota bacterium]